MPRRSSCKAPVQPTREFYFRPTTRAPTFSRFTKLPVELQVQIWKEAAVLDGNIDLDDDLLWSMGRPRQTALQSLKHFVKRTSPIRIHDFISIINPLPSFPDCVENMEMASQTRRGLMAACRLSREFAAAAWKSDVEAIVVRSCSGLDEERVELCPCGRVCKERKNEVLKVLDDVLK